VSDKVLISLIGGWVSELVCLIGVKLYIIQHCPPPPIIHRIFSLKCVCIVKFHNPNPPPAVAANVCKLKCVPAEIVLVHDCNKLTSLPSRNNDGAQK
jgi:hypothetical protein